MVEKLHRIKEILRDITDFKMVEYSCFKNLRKIKITL